LKSCRRKCFRRWRRRYRRIAEPGHFPRFEALAVAAVPRQIGRFGEHGAIPSLESLFAVLGELGVAKAAIGPAMNEDDLRLLRAACDQADERLIELKDEIPYLGFVGFDFF
jgi:hypothetical protein